MKESELQYIDAVGVLEASIPTSPAQSELINTLEALATDAAWSVDIDQVTQSDGVMSVTLGVD